MSALVDALGPARRLDAWLTGRHRNFAFATQAAHQDAMVLNSSFNENEPMVCRPEEALDCILRTKMDVLVWGNRLVRRSQKRLGADIYFDSP